VWANTQMPRSMLLALAAGGLDFMHWRSAKPVKNGLDITRRSSATTSQQIQVFSRHH
jgi:hypothetical protein